MAPGGFSRVIWGNFLAWARKMRLWGSLRPLSGRGSEMAPGGLFEDASLGLSGAIFWPWLEKCSRRPP
eukprot:847241-Karenia_brevis.AAC.1